MNKLNENKPILDIKDLFVRYNTDDAVVHALNGLNLKIKKGEVRGVVGETGAGKTTMALSILGLLPEGIGEISGGSILFQGNEMVNAKEKILSEMRGKSISMIFQDPMSSLNPVICVGDQIAEVVKLHYPKLTRNEVELKTEEIMEMIGIPPQRKNEYPYQFSGGMKQRIVIAIALVCEPDLLIADEPTTALDVTIQAQILELMKQLKEKMDTSMIFITHDLGVVAEFCDTVSVIYGGEVIESGTVEQIFAKDRNHPYTKGLFECIPYMESTSKRLTPILGSMPDPTNLPQGCSFCDRCAYAQKRCKNEKPSFYSAGAHEIKCFLYEDAAEVDNE